MNDEKMLGWIAFPPDTNLQQVLVEVAEFQNEIASEEQLMFTTPLVSKDGNICYVYSLEPISRRKAQQYLERMLKET